MREKSRDSPSPKPWRSRQAMSAPDNSPINYIIAAIYSNEIISNSTSVKVAKDS